ncbi:ABC transporter ATP-binding protein [Croceibacterium ferulae]|uniref:ABC transporter ATP-binding protein n=1 Tax=Croceibacterium ferulae TaxID=1854641 RepID=UPI000F86C0D7|nr:ABC transporter ATP-binding protein [Croceibacterium ferulae]
MRRLIFAWVREAFRAFPLRIAMLLVFSVLISIMDGLSISMLIPLIGILFTGSSLMDDEGGALSRILSQLVDLAGVDNRLFMIAGFIVALVAARVVLTYINSINVVVLGSRLSLELAGRIHQRLLDSDYQFLCVTDHGTLINTLDTEVWNVTDAIFAVFDLFSSACIVLALGTLLLLISPELTLIAGLLVTAVSIIRRAADKRVRDLGTAKVRGAEAYSVRSYELLDNMRMTRAYGQEPQVQQQFVDITRRLMRIDVDLARVNNAISGMQEVAYAAIVALLLIAAVWIDLGQASLIAFIALLHRLQPNIAALERSRTGLVQADASLASVSRVDALPAWSRRATGTARLPALEGQIVFDRISFSYDGKSQERRAALADATFTIPLGRTTALVGASGAGKSTITNLLYRFHDPDSGTISVAGTPLMELDLGWWRAQLAISGQDTGLISGSVRENIAWARPDASQGEIEEAARAAEIHDFIAGLPLGYDTQVGERGVLLSGGQRQRIEIARALLRPGAILILDEATNALDSVTEAEVLATLRRGAADRTVLVIAHRLATTRDADHVIVLDRGQVVEQGTPAALAGSGGLYSRMLRLQEVGSRLESELGVSR